MEVCERNSCVRVTIATRNVVTGEEWLKCEKVLTDNESDSYTIAVKKEGIIVGHLPQKYLEIAE